MIRIYAPGIDPSDLRGETRVGANLLIENSEYVVCVDGRFGSAADKVVKRLDSRGKKKILFLSHPHGDHIGGLDKELSKNDDIFALICQDPASLNKKYSAEAKGNVEKLEALIAKAKKKHVPVIFAKDGQRFEYGDIGFKTYRDQPSSARNTETYINQGSLCLWVPELSFLYTGDTGAYCAKRNGLKVKVITGLHHGNWLESEGRDYLKKVGCLFYWDDDYSTKMTNFLETGRGNAVKAGMTIFDLHDDINLVAFKGKTYIYKGGKIHRYDCSYTGPSGYKATTLTVVSDVLSGKYSKGDSRTTKLLDNGFNPGSVQGWINKLYQLIKG